MIMIDFFLTAGLPAIDENLEKVIDALQGYNIGSFGGITEMAAGWAWLFLFIMLSWEFIKMIGLNYQWSLAKLLRPFAFVILLSFYGTFADAIMAPGNALKGAGRGMATVQNKMVEKKQKEVDSLANKYRNLLVAKITNYRSIEKTMAQQRTAERQLEEEKSLLGILESLGGATLSATVGNVAGPAGAIAGAVANPVKGAIEEIRKIFIDGEEDIFTSTYKDLEALGKQWAVTLETTVAEMINEFIKFLSELALQMMYYGMLIVAEFGRQVLYMFGPLAIAVSVIPPFSDAWSTWVARMVNITLYPFLVFICIAMIDEVFMVTLDTDLKAYQELLKEAEEITGNMPWEKIGELGLSSLGSTVSYVAAALAGSYAMKMVPEVASWIMPAGASSGIAAAAGGFGKIFKTN